MSSLLVLEGSGEELLAQADKWKNRRHLKLVEVAEVSESYRDCLPSDAVWEDGIPVFPQWERATPITMEQIKIWQEDGE